MSVIIQLQSLNVSQLIMMLKFRLYLYSAYGWTWTWITLVEELMGHIFGNLPGSLRSILLLGAVFYLLPWITGQTQTT